MIKNIGNFFEKATVNTKQKLISSIFKEKLVFDNEKYRTPILNKGVELISKSISLLEGLENKNGRLSYDNLPLQEGLSNYSINPDFLRDKRTNTLLQ